MLNGYTMPEGVNLDKITEFLSGFTKSFGGIFLCVVPYLILCYIFMRLFRKAGKKDCLSAFIPLLNLWELTGIVFGKGKEWLCIFVFIPQARYIYYIALHIGLARAFGQKTWVGVLSAFLPALAIIFCIILIIICPPVGALGFFFLVPLSVLPIFPVYYAFNPNVKYTGPVESL